MSDLAQSRLDEVSATFTTRGRCSADGCHKWIKRKHTFVGSTLDECVVDAAAYERDHPFICLEHQPPSHVFELEWRGDDRLVLWLDNVQLSVATGMVECKVLKQFADELATRMEWGWIE